jgi:hypothetical protein
VSADHGETWNAVNIIGLPINSVNKLSVKSDKVGTDELYAATEKGVFIYTKGQWHADVQGLATNQIKDLAESTAGILYAATGEGVFVKASETAVRKHKAFPAKLNTHEFDQIFALEPTIADVHHMAVDYANVNPNQIKNWHKESRAKAFLPTLSVGLNRSATELLHWDSGSNPDTLLRGRDYLDWSTSLSWNFSDFVWSSDHTTIDSRSKLMSELRTDILDQITRLYFERRRIQVELATRMDLDEAAYLEKQMRLEELTALIDGFTGGEFSRNIRQNDLAKNP